MERASAGLRLAGSAVGLLWFGGCRILLVGPGALSSPFCGSNDFSGQQFLVKGELLAKLYSASETQPISTVWRAQRPGLRFRVLGHFEAAVRCLGRQ